MSDLERGFVAAPRPTRSAKAAHTRRGALLIDPGVLKHGGISRKGMGATYSLRAADAVHLATAVSAGADRFITNNTTDFPKAIAEVDITYPMDLPETQP